MAGQSRSGTCFFLSDDESDAGIGVQYCDGSGATCNANAAPAAVTELDPSW